ncbi:MAG: Mfa1 family fimbria major subunit, partial [Tannerellaceae bacterium]|nr:Mfa1 family fimbria major subunit [Tannerellaceae bacterium]
STDDERKFNTVTIIVFNTQGLCKVDTTVTLTSGGTQTDNQYKAVDINVPLGFHNVYAGINLTSGDAEKMRETLKTTSGVTKYVNLGTATAPAIAEIQKLYATTGFPMFSADVKPTNILPTPAGGSTPNKIEIALDRMVAKVTVRKNTTFTGTALAAAGATFSSTDLNWSLGNLNGKIYPYGKANNGQDPNYDYTGSLKDAAGKTYCTQNFVNDFSTAGAYGSWTGLASTVDENGTDVKLRKAKYAPENNSAQKRKGESTFTVVKAKFAPDSVATFKTGNTAPVMDKTIKPTLSGTETFYIVRSTAVYYFKDKTEADNYKTFLGVSEIKVEEFKGQFCFYHIFMNQGITSRNNYYDIQLNKFNGLGTPTGELTDDEIEQTVDNKGLLEVTVSINKWVIVSENHDLE